MKKNISKNEKNKEQKTVEKKTDFIPIIEYNDLMDTKEVSEFLRISMDTLYKWVEEGVIPHYRLSGKKILFNRQTLSKWLSEMEIGPTVKTKKKVG